VAWYEGRVLRRGELLGSTYEDRPYIRASDDLVNPVSSYDRIRFDDPDHPVDPMWRSLPPDGFISKPDADRCASLRRLADKVVPSGATPYKIAHEIWLRGFEVFLTGSHVRDNIAGQLDTGIELVTTMPPGRLRQMIVDMFGAAHTDGTDPAKPDPVKLDAGKLAALAGKVRVGGQEGTPDPFVIVRVFRNNQPGNSNSIYGASFELDMAYGDFACNALYYDLENEKLIDPSGHGIDDMATCCLRLVLDENRQSQEDLAYVGLAVLQQYLVHYALCPGDEDRMLALLERGLPALDRYGLIAALQAKVINRVRSDPAGRDYSKKDILDGMEGFFTKFNRKDLWDTYIFPLLGYLDLGGSGP
jgi:hypothetical protein